jgi:hypothetical protein
VTAVLAATQYGGPGGELREFVGTYHEAETGEVKDGTAFGPSQTYTGTYSPGGTYAEGLVLGAAAQLAIDQAAVHAAEAGILDTVTILTHTGTYHEATVAEVQSGVTFGPGETYTGTYASGGGGGLLVHPGMSGGMNA